MKTKSIYELLCLLKNHFRMFGRTYSNPTEAMEIDGLCILVRYLHSIKIINILEVNKLKEYIADNRPDYVPDEFKPHWSDMDYYWFPGERKPRKQWLNQHIKLNKPKDYVSKT